MKSIIILFAGLALILTILDSTNGGYGDKPSRFSFRRSGSKQYRSLFSNGNTRTRGGGGNVPTWGGKPPPRGPVDLSINKAKRSAPQTVTGPVGYCGEDCKRTGDCTGCCKKHYSMITRIKNVSGKCEGWISKVCQCTYSYFHTT